MQQAKRFFSPGFTLVELLVTIGIIVILAAGGMSVYTTSQKRGRDVRRVQDLKAIQNAFEQYYVANGAYNATCSTMAGELQGGIPLDPNGVAYFQSCTASSYCLCTSAQLEIADKGNSNAGNNCTNFATGGDYFCVKNLQ